MTEEPLSLGEAHAYWADRHRKHAGDWRSVGYIGGSPEVNRAFYRCRLRALRRALRQKGIALGGLRVLDVGCGLGVFSKVYAESGAEVYGVDISADAVAYCESLGIGTFRTGPAGEVAALFEGPFDIIHCFDVLYHLTDAAEWEAALAGFAALSTPATLWMVTEFHASTAGAARHLVKRPFGAYRRQLAVHGRTIVREDPVYWLFSAWPGLGTRLPSLILPADAAGGVAKRFMKEYVALWVVGAEGDA